MTVQKLRAIVAAPLLRVFCDDWSTSNPTVEGARGCPGGQRHPRYGCISGVDCEIVVICPVGAAAPQDDPQNSLRFQSSWPGSRHPRHNSQDRESSVIIGVPKETYPGERRIARVPLVIPTLAKAGFEIVVEAGAGMEAGYPDVQYAEKGAKVVSSRPEVFRAADIVVQVLCYGSNDINGRDDLALMRSGQVLVGFLRPLGSVDVVQEIASAGIISFA